ncbi:MAG: phosphatase PAP2 family protein [Acidimicrobiia bacterium]
MWLDWRIAAAAAVVLVALGCTLRPTTARRAAARPFLFETAVVLALYAIWHWVGLITVTQSDGALRNAQSVVNIEQVLHIGSERAWQQAVLSYPWLVQAANIFYAVVHVPALIVLLVWCFVRHRDRYPAVRNVVALTTLGCLLIQLIPVAPPRMFPGFVDTGLTYGQSVYGAGTVSADQVAAMPSLHVGWAALIAAAVIVVSESKWRWWILAHPVITTVVVVVTANHWWLDGIAAVAVLAAAEALRRALAFGFVWVRARAFAFST